MAPYPPLLQKMAFIFEEDKANCKSDNRSFIVPEKRPYWPAQCFDCIVFSPQLRSRSSTPVKNSGSIFPDGDNRQTVSPGFSLSRNCHNCMIVLSRLQTYVFLSGLFQCILYFFVITKTGVRN